MVGAREGTAVFDGMPNHSREEESFRALDGRTDKSGDRKRAV